MAAIDFFCAPDDRHRVTLLVDLLEKAGQGVTLRCGPTEEPTRPCLVACTRRAFREPWIAALFTRSGQVAALRLDDAPLPGPAAQIIDMRAWPARSADRNAGRLVDWLQNGDRNPAAETRARANASGRDRDRRAAGPLRLPKRLRLVDANVPGGLTLLGLLAAGAVLLSLVAPQRHEPSLGAEERDPETPIHDLADPARQEQRPLAGPAPELRVASLHEPGPGSSSDPAGTGGRWNDSAHPHLTAPPPASIPEPDPLPHELRMPSEMHLDALWHLCQARSITAARAWAGVLSGRQRRRLPDEPCVQRLLARPGFDEIALLLDLS